MPPTLQSKIIELFDEKFNGWEGYHKVDGVGTFDAIKSFLIATLLPLIQEEERAKCRGLMEEVKGEMGKKVQPNADVIYCGCDGECFGACKKSFNSGLSTCISILEGYKNKLQ